MAEKELNDNFVEQMMQHVRNRENFLLSGGAGSGKTYSLIKVLRKILEEYPYKNVACITYTNNAVDEIKSRFNDSNLAVSTIHDFLWSNIGSFQNEIKASLPQIINSEDYKTRFKDLTICDADYFNNIYRIEYKESLNLKNGKISHNEVLELAHYMFANYPRLCRVLRDRYPVILIDEYQDTDPLVVQILLNYISPPNLPEGNKCVVGFFGDQMQSIYDSGVGDINNYTTTSGGHVYEIKKEYNRRNPQRIIDLANKLRIDGLVQKPSSDLNAPNMDADSGMPKQGKITFIYSDGEIYHDSLRRYITDNFGWEFGNSKETKELNLTHNIIANKCGFPNLMEIFSGDKIIDYCKAIRKIADSSLIDKDLTDKSFGVVLEILKSRQNSGYKKPQKKQQEYIDSHPELWEMACNTSYEKMTDIYVDNSQLIDDIKDNEDDKGKTSSKTSPVIKHLKKIEDAIAYYRKEQFGRFLKLTDKTLHSIQERRNLKFLMDDLANTDGLSIGEVIDKADKNGIISKDDRLLSFIEEYPYVYERVRRTPYQEFRNRTEYVEGKTPFSTQHKTKGSEFDNVLIMMQNNSWTKYNFDYLMGCEPKVKSDSVLNRTKKLFYVCCTRAKKHLIVYYISPTPGVLSTAKEWFGEENVIQIDNDSNKIE